MFNIFKRPLHIESLESWCKILDDVAKIAVVAIPVIIYADKPLTYRIMNGILLLICAYFSLASANALRKNKEKLTKE